MAGRLQGRVAVVTGGASGIGEATVRLFASEGARVVIADVQDERGKRLEESLAGRAVYQHTDVVEERDVAAMIARAIEAFGRLDVLFNNAGFGGAVGSIESIPVDEYDRTMNVLMRGVFLGLKHAAGPMRTQGSGSIINTASVAGLRGGYAPHLYAAAKAGVIQLTKTVALELGESGVRVNCICPGGIATPLLASAFGGTDEAVEMIKPFLATMQPLRRVGLPRDIAQAALFLASDEGSFVNGHALVVDGGLTAGTQWSQQPAPMRERKPMA